MSSKQQQRLTEGAAAYLEPGEHVVTALIAQARGTSQSRTTRGALGGIVGSVAGDVFGKSAREANRAAAEQDLVIRSPMGLVLTDRRLFTLEIDGMSKGNVKGLLSALPLDAVDSIEKKWVGLLGAKIELTVRGTLINLECTSKSEVVALADAFRALKDA